MLWIHAACFLCLLVSSFAKSQSITIFGVEPPTSGLVPETNSIIGASEVGVGSDGKTTVVETEVASRAILTESVTTLTYLSTPTTYTLTYVEDGSGLLVLDDDMTETCSFSGTTAASGGCMHVGGVTPLSSIPFFPSQTFTFNFTGSLAPFVVAASPQAQSPTPTSGAPKSCQGKIHLVIGSFFFCAGVDYLRRVAV